MGLGHLHLTSKSSAREIIDVGCLQLQAITLKRPMSVIVGTQTYRVNSRATFYSFLFFIFKFFKFDSYVGGGGNGGGGKLPSGSSKNILNSFIISIFSFYGISINESHIIHKII